MKKFVAIILAIVMVAALTVGVLAEDKSALTEPEVLDALNENTTCDVDVLVDADSLETIDTVYYVTVAWESLDFTYTFNGTVEDTWNPLTHTYTTDGDAMDNWDKTSAVITVTNHSNSQVNVTADIDGAAKNGVTASLDKASSTLATAVGTLPTAAPADTFTVSIAGTPDVEEDFTLDTVTITLAQ